MGAVRTKDGGNRRYGGHVEVRVVSAISVHDTGDVGNGDHVGRAAQQAGGDRVDRGAFRSLHVEPFVRGFLLSNIVVVFPLVVVLLALASQEEPPDQKGYGGNDKDASDNSAGNGTNVWPGCTRRGLVVRLDACHGCTVVAILRNEGADLSAGAIRAGGSGCGTLHASFEEGSHGTLGTCDMKVSRGVAFGAIISRLSGGRTVDGDGSHDD